MDSPEYRKLPSINQPPFDPPESDRLAAWGLPPEREAIKPIPTVYKGYRCRSRLEARWAIFFDWEDYTLPYRLAVEAARGARFEYGESPE